LRGEDLPLLHRTQTIREESVACCANVSKDSTLRFGFAAAWNADTQLNAREPGAIPLGDTRERHFECSGHDFTVRRERVDAKAIDIALEPKSQHREHCSAHIPVAPVEIRLLLQEGVVAGDRVF
jgi:hypothetical protein